MNKYLIEYCAVFFQYFLRAFLAEGKFPRINLYTKESGNIIMSLYATDDKSAQGIVIYEGNQRIDEPLERAEISHDAYFIVGGADPSLWTQEAAERDLKEALKKMGR